MRVRTLLSVAGLMAAASLVFRLRLGRSPVRPDSDGWYTVIVDLPGNRVRTDALPAPLEDLGDLIEVQTADAPGGRGTAISVHIRRPESPEGTEFITSRISSDDPRQAVPRALREAKHIIEVGDVSGREPPSQRHGRGTPAGKLLEDGGAVTAPGTGAKSPSTAPRRSQLPSLTGLRWVAALFVFGYHTGNMGYFPGAGHMMMRTIFGAGTTGVSLFFILSGFVLTWAYDERTSFLAFWRRRFARIVPVHLVALGGALILASTIVPSIRTANPWAVVANATLLSSWNPAWWQAGNPVSWSLVCEAFFYLAFPLVIRPFLNLRRCQTWAAAVAALVLVFAVPAFHTQLPAVIGANSSPLGRFPEFLLGVALGRLISCGFWRGPALWSAAMIAVTGYVIDTLSPTSAFTNTGYTAIGFSLLIASLARADEEGRRTFLAHRWLVHLGTLSFSFYLVHLLILQSIGSLWPGSRPALTVGPGSALTALAMAVSIAAAHLLHTFVEKPARRALTSPRRRYAVDARVMAVEDQTGGEELLLQGVSRPTLSLSGRRERVDS